uniref:Rh blood group, D antigen n=1 Tax=Sinocyclocheilus anshuiensis TaxID=1608454 RepID=A0A671KHC2_9TELE
MAPQYAPSLRSRLPLVAFLLETIFILLFFLYLFRNVHIANNGNAFLSAEFQDIHVMIFMGFGFLATFLLRYAVAIQWAVLMNGFLLPQRHHRREIHINIKSVIEAELCAASALVVMGAVHGKTNPVQLLLMALVEVTGFVVNQWILRTLLSVREVLLSQIKVFILYIYIYFSLCLVSWVLHREGIEPVHEKEKTDHKTGLFAMNILPFSLPHMFLWMFWPSFNSTLVGDHKWERGLKLTVIYGTYLSLAVSVVMAMSVSMLTSSKGKMNMVHVQSSTLSGGVAIGVAMTAVHTPWIAMTIGLSLISLGIPLHEDKPTSNHMLFAFECHDTCSVLNFALLFLRLASNESTIAVQIAVYHICVLLIKACMSLVMGTATGLFLKWSIWRPQLDRKCFDDQAFWELKGFVHLHHSKYVVYNDLTPLLNLAVFAFIFYNLKVELMTLNLITFTNMSMIANYVFVSLVVSKFGCTEIKNLWTNL